MRMMEICRGYGVVVLVVVALGVMACTQSGPMAPAAAAPEGAPAAAPAKAAASVKAAPVANAAGTWKWSVDAGGTPITHTAVLKQDGEKLTGTFTDSFDNTTVDIKEGTIHDGEVMLIVVRPFQDAGTMNFKFVGKLEGDTIKGKMDFTIGDQQNTADWNAQRGS